MFDESPEKRLYSKVTPKPFIKLSVRTSCNSVGRRSINVNQPIHLRSQSASNEGTPASIMTSFAHRPNITVMDGQSPVMKLSRRIMVSQKLRKNVVF
jgi:hypothetical protein